MEYKFLTGRFLIPDGTIRAKLPAAAGAAPGCQSHKSYQSHESQQSRKSTEIPVPSIPGEGGDEQSATVAGWIADLHRQLPDRIRKKIVRFDREAPTLRLRRWLY